MVVAKKASETNWLTLPTAVAWVLTRDIGLIERLVSADAATLKALAIEMAFATTCDGRRFDRLYDDHREAWEALRSEAGAGRIKVAGVAFIKLSDGQGGETVTRSPTAEISEFEIETLDMDDNVGRREVALVPSDWRVRRGSDFNNDRGFFSVRVKREDLISAFPAIRTPKALDAGAMAGDASLLMSATATTMGQSFKPLRGKVPRIVAILQKRYVRGVPDAGLAPRQILISEILDEDGSLKPLDRKTLKRAIDMHNALIGK